MNSKSRVLIGLASFFKNSKKCSCPKTSPKFGRREGDYLRCDECGGLFELPDWVLQDPDKN